MSNSDLEPDVASAAIDVRLWHIADMAIAVAMPAFGGKADIRCQQENRIAHQPTCVTCMNCMPFSHA
jgi:hypothetical protein